MILQMKEQSLRSKLTNRNVLLRSRDRYCWLIIKKSEERIHGFKEIGNYVSHIKKFIRLALPISYMYVKKDNHPSKNVYSLLNEGMLENFSIHTRKYARTMEQQHLKKTKLFCWR